MPSQPHFSFAVQGFAPDTFHVVRFSGTEGLSKLYDFELTLLAKDPDLDMAQALSATATFTVHRPESSDLVWKGILKDLRLTGVAKGQAFFKAHLAPKAWLATQSFHNRIFLNQDLVQNLGDCLEDAGLAHGLDFELRLTASYPRREYVCQYNESHFAFVSRWCERNGLYFYFDQSGPQEKLLITDSRNVHAPHPAGEPLVFADASGLDSSLTGKAVKNLQREAKRLPAKVLVKDYNYRIPGLDIRAEAPVSQSGFGQVYVHGGHLRSLKQAAFLASIRAQSLACREAVVFGESNAPFVQPGYLFDLSGHPRKDCNGSFLTVEVRHEGAQEAWLTSGLGLTGLGDRLFYRNGFAAIPSSVQFRAEIKTPRPFIHGSLSARVDAEGSGKYAELDELGRYKVLMPFDVSGRKDGHASSWVRMATPYAGPDHGLHLPLHKGTEVALIFVEGDPDQPVIAGAVPNPATPSVVTDSNQTTARLLTAGGNALNFQDQQGQEQMLLSSPQMQTSVSLGAPMAQASASSASALASAQPSAWQQAQTVAGYNLYTNGMFAVQAQLNFEMILGMSTQIIGGALNLTCFGANDTVNFGGVTEINFTTTYEFYLLKRETCINEGKTAETEERMVEQVSELLGDRSTLAESIENIVNEKINVLATKDEVADQVTSVFQGAQNIFATRSELVESQETILSAVAETIAEETSTLASKEEVAASLTTTVEAMSAVVSTQEQMAGTIEVMSTSIQNLAAEMNFVTTEMNMV